MNPLGEASKSGLTVTAATVEDWHQVTAWANGEGWNVGNSDAALFHAADPAGFFVGRIGTRLVSAISIVNYSEEYAFLGHYLVDPQFRGHGFGLATWRVAFPYAGTRNIGLDAALPQQSSYQKFGFAPVYQTVRYGGRVERSGTTAAGALPVNPEHLDAVAMYDRDCFPADRRAFVRRWLTAAGHTAYARLSDGGITGYGVIRPARDGYRIGPLFADTPEDAEALFQNLTAHLGPDDEVFLDVPETQKAAGALVTDRGLTALFPTVRMYTGLVPAIRTDRIFAITSLELG